MKNKLIKDIRVYSKGISDSELSPFSYQYSHIFLKLLKEANFCCPEYDHIYNQI